LKKKKYKQASGIFFESDPSFYQLVENYGDSLPTGGITSPIVYQMVVYERKIFIYDSCVTFTLRKEDEINY